MNTIIVQNAILSKQYNKEEIITFKVGKNEVKMASFRVSEPIYDANAENCTHWNSYYINCYDYLAEKLERLKLKQGAILTIVGQLTVEQFNGDDGTDKTSLKIRAVDINYAPSHKKKEGSTSESDDDNNSSLAQNEEPPTESKKNEPSPTPESPYSGFKIVEGDTPNFFG